MRKHLLLLGVVLAGISVGILSFKLPAKADSASPWITSTLSIQKQTDTLSLPISLNGNIDCYRETSGNCVVPTSYGSFSESNSSIRFSSEGSYKSVINYIEGSQHVLAIPNSNMLISYRTTPIFGWYLYFNNTYAFIKPDKIYTNYGQQDVYKITAAPDGQLADLSGHLLAADYSSMSFSANSEWLVATDPNVATLRVNLRTLEVMPFGPSFQYGIGNPPDVKTAITNEGRYAVEASYNQSRFAIYDLSTCDSPPDIITGPITCQYRDLRPFIQQQIPGFKSATNIRFLDDDTLSFYGSYYVGSTLKTSRFILSTKNINSQISYLALGDSYISGEGAFDYTPGSDIQDENNKNTCHLSFLSYPYLINNELGFNENNHPSVACSGAITADIIDTSIPNGNEGPQSKGKDLPNFDAEIYANFLPGYRAQVNFISHYQPKAITVSIGGNDMGFSKILMRCMEADNCYSDYEDRVELVREINNIVFPSLVNTYQLLKSTSAPDARIYIIGYPQIAKPDGDCADNVRLSNEEVKFSQQIIAYLDSVIKSAADRAGVKYVDVQDAFDGHRLCETNFADSAMNGITAGDDRPFSFGPIGAESYHPTPLGYQLLKDKILTVTGNLTSLMPPPDASAGPPPENGQEILNSLKSGRPINAVNYDDKVTNDVQYRKGAWKITYKSGRFLFKSGSKVLVYLKSDTVFLGEYDTDQNGNLDIEVTAPENVPIGFHTLHLYGTDIAGQPVDIQKIIYVRDSPAADESETQTIDQETTEQASAETQNTPEDTSTEHSEINNHAVVAVSTAGTGTPPKNSATPSLLLQNAEDIASDTRSDSHASVLGIATPTSQKPNQSPANEAALKPAIFGPSWKIVSPLLLAAVLALLVLLKRRALAT